MKTQKLTISQCQFHGADTITFRIPRGIYRLKLSASQQRRLKYFLCSRFCRCDKLEDVALLDNQKVLISPQILMGYGWTMAEPLPRHDAPLYVVGSFGDTA